MEIPDDIGDYTVEDAERLIEVQKTLGLRPWILNGNALYPDEIYEFHGIGYLLKPSKEES